MLAASLRRDVQHLNIISGGMIVSRVPRCLFGQPNPKDTVELLQEALDMERSKFTRRWGVDPCDDKENNLFQRKVERSPRKRTTIPYARQTNIHEYWRSRKACDTNKKLLSTSTSDCGKYNEDSNKNS